MHKGKAVVPPAVFCESTHTAHVRTQGNGGKFDNATKRNRYLCVRMRVCVCFIAYEHTRIFLATSCFTSFITIVSDMVAFFGISISMNERKGRSVNVQQHTHTHTRCGARCGWVGCFVNEIIMTLERLLYEGTYNLHSLSSLA